MQPTIQTFSGREINLVTPSVSSIHIGDISHALSNLCRYTGHVTQFYCPTEDQRVLTADLRWVPAGDLVVGDELVAFDERPHEIGAAGKRRRKFRPALVTHAERVKRRVITLEMSDGSSVTASEEHPWLVATKVSRNQEWLTCREISDDLSAGRRRYMHKFAPTWATVDTRTAGWLAGMYDGEGYISVRGRKGVQLGVSQKVGPTLERIAEALVDHGFGSLQYAQTGTVNSGVNTIQLGGGWREVMRLLGSIRPHRLLGKFSEALLDGGFDKQLDGVGEPLQIVSATDGGEQWVAGLETSTHTYICEGYAAHNSVAQHSYLVSRWCSPENALWGLLHDASEAYLGDVSSPLKHLLQDYRLLEANVMETVCRAFDLPLEEPAEVKHFDLVALATERRDLMPNHQGINWSTLDRIAPEERPITPLPPKLAEALFLNRFYELMDERAKAKWRAA